MTHAWMIVIALTLLAHAAPAAADVLHWRDTTYTTHERTPVAITAQAARLVVPEDAAKPGGAVVELAVLRLRATTHTPGPPIVYLHGGPGGSAAEHLELPEFRALFDSLRAVGDVVMFDQRGCGASTPTLLPVDVPRMNATTLATRENFLTYLADASAFVRDRLVRTGHDPHRYTALASVDDVEALRAALASPTIHLLGHSYGAQLAQAYLRSHPEGVGRLVLAGARGMDTARKLPAEADTALSRIATLARTDRTLGAQCPDLLGMLARTLAKLDAAPLAVTMQGSDGTFTLEVGGDALRFIVAKFYLNDPDNFRYLPKLLDEIDKGRRPWSLIFNLGNMIRGGVSFAWFTTDAASGVSAERAALIRSQAATSPLRDAMNFPFPEINRVWTMPDAGESFRQPVRADHPVLLVAGSLDGITPVAQSREILHGFPNGHLLVVENAGHVSLLRAPGVAGAIAGFLAGRTTPASAALPPVEFAPLVTPRAAGKD